MAKGKKTGGKSFKKGESGNPNGRPSLPDDVKEAREINKIELERILNKYIHMTFKQIQKVCADDATPVLDLMICKIIGEAIKKGDQVKLGFILDRLPVGPVKKTINLDGKPLIAPTVILRIPKNGREAPDS